MTNNNKTVKVIVSDFSAMQNALNKIIIAELKAALKLVPDQKIGEQYARNMDDPSLCRIVVSEGEDYYPRDLAVWKAWLDNEGKLHVAGGTDGETIFATEYTEDDAFWMDITDFQYLIEQLKGLMPDDGKVHNLRTDAQIASDFNHFAVMNDAVNKTIKY